MQNKFSTMLFLALNLLSCSLFRSHEQDTADLIPAEIEMPGWKITVQREISKGENIDGYIKSENLDPASDFGFKELYIAKYKSLSDSLEEITVEIYKMDSPLNAFGILSMERGEEFQKENQYDYFYSDRNALLFQKGNYYIKIKTPPGNPASGTALRSFFTVISSKIKTSSGLPDHVSLFGGRDDKKSLKYNIGGLPVLPEIKNIFIRKIEISGNIKTVLFAKRNSTYNSFVEFSNLLKDKEKNFILSGAAEVQTAFSETNDKRYIFISVYKEWIFGITDADSMSEGEKAVYYLYNNLIEFLKDN